MNYKNMSFLALSTIFGFLTVQAQDDNIRAINDSTQSTILHSTEKQIQSIFQQLDSIKFVYAGEKNVDDVIFDIEDVHYVRRLNALQREIALNYNAHVRNYIDLYSTKRYQSHLTKMMGLSQYYFPIFEKALTDIGVPTELKYLAIVESALNPHAVSRVGATGPWQFMHGTAKGYDLTMNNYIDERKDPYASSYAAARYMKEAYTEFGDWLLAIASYNCGKGAVKRAIARCGKFNPNYWDVSPFLPRETRNYVPAFIAMNYMFGYAEMHQIKAPDQLPLNLFTETIMVDKFVALTELAKALDIPYERLKEHNPAYKRPVINGSLEAPKRLVIPIEGAFKTADLYAALQTASTVDGKEVPAATDDVREARATRTSSSYHAVRKGETLDRIASANGVTVQDLKSWNSLRTATIRPGQRLLVKSAGVSPKLAQKASTAKSSRYVMYTVRKGDTLSAIANAYKGATVRQIKADNGIRGTLLKPGTKLKINKG